MSPVSTAAMGFWSLAIMEYIRSVMVLSMESEMKKAKNADRKISMITIMLKTC